MDISFEFFPPNSSEADKKLWSSIKLLEPLNPKFVSVTYGAGGSTRERTHDCVNRSGSTLNTFTNDVSSPARIGGPQTCSKYFFRPTWHCVLKLARANARSK